MTDGNDPVAGCTHGAVVDEKLKGLTKREHFMGLAMQACIIWDAIINHKYQKHHFTSAKVLAEAALTLADAHLAQLDKGIVPDPVEVPAEDPPIASE